jgi:NADPH:quinone reductase-like Zn-dependent oxidoreductase
MFAKTMCLPSSWEPQEAASVAELGVRLETFLVESDHAGMSAIAELVEAGSLRAHIEAIFALADTAKAHALGETGGTRPGFRGRSGPGR